MCSSRFRFETRQDGVLVPAQEGKLSRIIRGIAIDRFRNMSRETAVSRDEFNPKFAHVDVRFPGVDLFLAEINLC